MGEDNASGPHQGSAHSFPPEMVPTAPTTTPSRGMVTGTSQAWNSEQSCTSAMAPLGRNERRKLGVVLSYVTSFLRVRGPGCHSPELWGEVGGGKVAFFPAFAASPPGLRRPRQTSELDRQAQCFPRAPAPRRHLALRAGNQEGLLSQCVKQGSAGFPGRKPGSGLLTGTWGQKLRERGLGPSTMPTHAPSFLHPKFSPLPLRESAMVEGPKGR